MSAKVTANAMVRHSIVCKSCKAVLGIVTIFGELHNTHSRGIKGGTDYYQITVDSCGRCSNKAIKRTAEFHMASEILQKINDGASLSDIKKFLQTFAPKDNDFLQSDYPIKVGEPHSFEEMQKHLPNLFTGTNCATSCIPAGKKSFKVILPPPKGGGFPLHRQRLPK